MFRMTRPFGAGSGEKPHSNSLRNSPSPFRFLYESGVTRYQKDGALPKASLGSVPVRPRDSRQSLSTSEAASRSCILSAPAGQTFCTSASNLSGNESSTSPAAFTPESTTRIAGVLPTAPARQRCRRRTVASKGPRPGLTETSDRPCSRMRRGRIPGKSPPTPLADPGAAPASALALPCKNRSTVCRWGFALHRECRCSDPPAYRAVCQLPRMPLGPYTGKCAPSQSRRFTACDGRALSVSCIQDGKDCLCCVGGLAVS